MEYTQRRRSGRLRLLIAAAIAIVFAFSFSSSFSSSAATAIFKIQNVELSEISATSEGSIEYSDGENITSNIKFNRLGDSAKFTITIKNTDSNARTIESITNDNTSTYISYLHDSYANTSVKAGETFDFIVTVKYISTIANPSESAQATNVKFTIKYQDGEPETIAINPQTWDNISVNITSLIVFFAGLIIINVITFKKHRKASKMFIIGVIAVAAVTTTTTAKAITIEVNDFTLTTNFTFKAGRIIHYNGNYPDGGTMEDDRLTSTGTLKPNAYTAIGYHFAGWSLEPDGEKVYGDEEPMSNIPDGDEPLTLYVIWEQNTYTIVFHANSAQATGSMEPFAAKYDNYRLRLPYNEFVLNEYRFTGWKVDNQGGLIQDGASADQFETENNGTVNLYAQWELVPAGIDYYKNGTEAEGVTERQENFGRTTALRTPNYRRNGYGFAGWNTEPDGTGTMYGPNETVTMPSTGLKLYATWMQAEENVTMQTFDDTAEPYASYPTNKVIALKDNRDNQVYTVAKLPDGKWWMTENLRLNPAGIQLTAENTNNPAPAVQNITGSGTTCTENTTACINQFSYTSSSIAPSGSYGAFAYGNGVYYNAYAATAGHAAVDAENLVTEQVAGDICPKGWHLPVSGANGDIRTLDISLGGNGYNTLYDFEHAQKYFKFPINFITSGWREGKTGAYENIGTEAAYLENGTDGFNHSVSFFVDAATKIVDGTNPKYYTHTVRCIAN